MAASLPAATGLVMMSSMDHVAAGRGHRRCAAPYLYLLLLTALPLAVAALVMGFGSNSVPAGECHGLGGGCVLSTVDLAEMFLLFAGPVIIAWALVATLILVLLRRRVRYRVRPPFMQGLLPIAPLFVLLVLVLFS